MDSDDPEISLIHGEDAAEPSAYTGSWRGIAGL